jgi:hypothetical protein
MEFDTCLKFNAPLGGKLQQFFASLLVFANAFVTTYIGCILMVQINKRNVKEIGFRFAGLNSIVSKTFEMLPCFISERKNIISTETTLHCRCHA